MSVSYVSISTNAEWHKLEIRKSQGVVKSILKYATDGIRENIGKYMNYFRVNDAEIKK